MMMFKVVHASAVNILKLELYREECIWHLRKIDTQIRKAFQIFPLSFFVMLSYLISKDVRMTFEWGKTFKQAD